MTACEGSGDYLAADVRGGEGTEVFPWAGRQQEVSDLSWLVSDILSPENSAISSDRVRLVTAQAI